MRISVLLVVPAHETLRAAALTAFERRAPSTTLFVEGLPGHFELDPAFPPVPVGSPGQSALAALRPETCDRFVVRGFLEVDSVDQVPADLNGHPVFSDPEIAPCITCGGDAPVGNTQDVKAKLNVQQLNAAGFTGDGVAIAIMDTGINLAFLQSKLGSAPKTDPARSWVPTSSSTAPFQWPVGHGTMCAFDALIAAPSATLLDYAVLQAGGFPGLLLSTALQGMGQLGQYLGGTQPYKALISSNSWAIFNPASDFPKGNPGRYIDNPNHPFNVKVTALAAAGMDIVFAAGNCGLPCPDGRCGGNATRQDITGANAMQSVLTVAGCDTKDQRVGYSSQGPSIAGMYQQKPDVTSYTHFLGSEAFGPGKPDSGTSTACPVVAGCIAAMRTKISVSELPPANLFSVIRLNSRTPGGIADGWNADYGYGIVDINAVFALGAPPGLYSTVAASTAMGPAYAMVYNSRGGNISFRKIVTIPTCEYIDSKRTLPFPQPFLDFKGFTIGNVTPNAAYIFAYNESLKPQGQFWEIVGGAGLSIRKYVTMDTGWTQFAVVANPRKAESVYLWSYKMGLGDVAIFDGTVTPGNDLVRRNFSWDAGFSSFTGFSLNLDSYICAYRFTDGRTCILQILPDGSFVKKFESNWDTNFSGLVAVNDTANSGYIWAYRQSDGRVYIYQINQGGTGFTQKYTGTWQNDFNLFSGFAVDSMAFILASRQADLKMCILGIEAGGYVLRFSYPR